MEERSRVSARNARVGGLSHDQRAVGNEALLKRVRSFAADKGPEFIGDFFGPWAKWSLFIANALLESDEDAKQIINHVFGMSKAPPRMSPLELFNSFLHSLSEEVLQDTQTMAAVHSHIPSACSLSVLMLLNVAMGSLGWRWVIAFHLGLYVYKWVQISNQVQSKEDTLGFLAAHTFLCIIDAVATPPTLSCRFLVHFLGSIMVLLLWVGPKLSFGWFYVCYLLICFYTPLWFGLCIPLTCCALLTLTDDADQHGISDYVSLFAFFCMGLCVARILLYVSAGGFCGALLLFLVFVVLSATTEENAADMMAPLPLVCALLACFYVPFWVGVCFISTIVCSFALASNNVLAILWWIVSFATLHTLSYTFSRDFSVLSVCLLGSFFSYGCILI